MVLESLLGSVLGGVLRLAPEVIKFFDRKNERDHEARMMDKEMAIAQLKAEQAMHTVDAGVQLAQFEAMGKAQDGQTEMAKAGGKVVAGVSALVRPVVTYWVFAFYVACRTAALVLAFQQSAAWHQVMASAWTDTDMAVLMLVLTFWFTGRAWESKQGKR
jgi:leucyl aminopeptidase (aminopeptidase T)